MEPELAPSEAGVYPEAVLSHPGRQIGMDLGQKPHLLVGEGSRTVIGQAGVGSGEATMVGTGKGCPEVDAPQPPSLFKEPQQPADLCHWLVEEEVKSRTLLPVAQSGHLRDGMSWSAWPRVVLPVNVCLELLAPAHAEGFLGTD